jgi:rhamnogalacturonan hydrolase
MTGEWYALDALATHPRLLLTTVAPSIRSLRLCCKSFVTMLSSFAAALLAACTLPALALAQLSGPVGPLTPIAAKAAVKTCNVLDYGAKADNSTDLGPPLAAAFAACKTGGVVVIPSGEYAMATWVTFNGGSAWALQFDGTVYRTGTNGGNMIFIEHTSDFELFSSTSAGAFQGNGYIFHAQGSISGPRILRLYDVRNFSVHDVALVDSPSFHFSMDTCADGEVYNMAIRGGNQGGLDGIDVWSTNVWIHDVSRCVLWIRIVVDKSTGRGYQQG